jgi:hypothetical protein
MSKCLVSSIRQWHLQIYGPLHALLWRGSIAYANAEWFVRCACSGEPDDTVIVNVPELVGITDYCLHDEARKKVHKVVW